MGIPRTTCPVEAQHMSCLSEIRLERHSCHVLANKLPYILPDTSCEDEFKSNGVISILKQVDPVLWLLLITLMKF